MKKLLSILLTVFLAALSSTVYAACQGNSCTEVYVERLYVNTNSSGLIYIATSGDETLLNCQPHADVYTVLESSQPNADKIYSTLLAAQISDKKVRIRIREESVGCRIAYITLERQ